MAEDTLEIPTNSYFAVAESYITHLRIYEFGSFPSSPPPPNSSNTGKKERCIIVAVRTSGRLRLHKARENQNGTFSIGKTWPLDDLSAVRSYSSVVTGTTEENEQRQWAGSLGFTITLGKTYYWQAMFPKEKQFFIASVVKIYNKYTGGKFPQLTGFAERELEQLLGSRSIAQRPIPQQQQQTPQLPQPQPSPSSPLPTPPYGQAQNRPPARDPSREPRMRQQTNRDPTGRPSGPPSGASSAYASPRPPPSRERRDVSPNGGTENGGSGTTQSSFRGATGPNRSQESLSTETSSLPPRSRSGLNGTPNVPGRFPEGSLTPVSQRAMTPDSGYRGSKDTLNDAPPVPAPLSVPPERRRPPMPPPGDSSQRGMNSNESFVPAPLASPIRKRDDQRPNTRGNDGLQSFTPDRNIDPVTSPAANEYTSSGQETRREANRSNAEVDDNIPRPSTQDETLNTAIVEAKLEREIESSTQAVQAEEVDNRPGLVPMIKTKKNVANAMLGAAKKLNTINAFKPRPGGAAMRLQQTQSKPDGPDGITGVVPAPSLLRSMTDESAIVPASVENAPEKPASQGIPEVKITTPPVNGQSSTEGSVRMPQAAAIEKTNLREVRRQKPPAEIMDKELRAIGVDPLVIGDRGGDLITAWDEFGFAGQGMRSIDVISLQDQVQQELDRIQTGSDFLKFMNEQDDRVEAVHKGLDVTIEACEELDALLTLYLVELDVSAHMKQIRTMLTATDTHPGYCLHRGPVSRSAGPSSKSETSSSRASITPGYHFNIL